MYKEKNLKPIIKRTLEETDLPISIGYHYKGVAYTDKGFSFPPLEVDYGCEYDYETKEYYDCYWDWITPEGWVDIYDVDNLGSAPGDLCIRIEEEDMDAEDILSYAIDNEIPLVEAFNKYSTSCNGKKWKQIVVIDEDDIINIGAFYRTLIFGLEE